MLLEILKLGSIFNPFVPSSSFLLPLKTIENFTVLWCFQGVEKGCIENQWVNHCKSTVRWCGFCFGFLRKIIFWPAFVTMISRSEAIAKGSGTQLILACFCMKYINSIICSNDNLQWHQNKIGQWLNAKGGSVGLKFGCPLPKN